MNLDLKQPASFLLWSVAVLVFAVIARLGWELGGRLWTIF